MPKNRLSRYRSAFLYLFRYIRPHKRWYIAATITAFLLTCINLIQAKAIALLIDNSSKGDFCRIVLDLCIFIIIIVLTISLNHLSGISVSKLAANASKDLKQSICSKLIYAKYSDIIGLKSGDTLTMINTDTSVICDFISGDLIGLFSQFLLAFGAFAYLISINPSLCLITFAYTPLGMFFTLSLNKKMNILYPIAADSKGEALSVTEQILSCIPVFKSYNMGKQIKNRIHAQNENVYKTEMKISVWNALMQTACSSTARMPQLIYLIYAGYLVINGKLSIGTFIASYDLINYIIGPTVYFPFMLNSLNSSISSINRIKRLDKLTRENQNLQLVSTTAIKPAISIENVTFGYNDHKPVLNDFSFKHTGTGIIAVCGESGCGKTTLFDLISGLYRIRSGNIHIEGSIGVMAQQSDIFNLTVLDNILLGNPKADIKSAISAAKAAGADEFIKELPNGYETMLGDGNTDLSGGQKQRISLARLLIRNDSIWLLDEPTSALDYQTENLILNVIKQNSRSKLIIVSSHRKSLTDLADKVVYLKGAETI